MRETELPDVAQALERRRIDEAHRGVVDPDVVPERVADDLYQIFGPALRIASGTLLPNFSKFAANILASVFACAS